MLKKSLVAFGALVMFCFNVATVKSETNGVVVKTPTIINTDLQGNNSRWGRPIITGLTQKNTVVLVYVDNKFIGEAKVNTTKTATDNFYFQPIKTFNPGNHEVQVVAKDKNKSILSYISQKKIFTVNDLPVCHLNTSNKVATEKKPTISGTTVSGSRVSLYIDGVLNGTTDVVTGNSVNVKFNYTPFLNLKPGKHTVYAVTRTADNKFKSEKTNEVILTIEAALPAPTLIKAVINNKTTKASPFIAGVAKNKQIVKFYINDKLDGEIVVGEHRSGVANFAYIPKQKLNNGIYKIHAIAANTKGRVSIKSNLLSYTYKPTQATITKKAVSEEVVTKKKVKKVPAKKKTEKKKIETKKETPKKEESKKEEIKKEEIKATSSEEKKERTGAINEQKEQQGEIKLSLVIFIVFLMIVIGWIIWVNRELVKKEENSEAEEKKENK